MFINVRQRPNTVGLLVGADARTSVPTVRGWIIACVTYYSLVLACEAGTRHGHYNGWVVRCGWVGCPFVNAHPMRNRRTL